jgi:hypothetical protein
VIVIELGGGGGGGDSDCACGDAVSPPPHPAIVARINVTETRRIALRGMAFHSIEGGVVPPSY